MKKETHNFAKGVALIIISYVFGWMSLAMVAASVLKHPEVAKFFLGLYIFSWLLLGTGWLIAGKEGIKYAKSHMKSFFKRKKGRKITTRKGE